MYFKLLNIFWSPDSSPELLRFVTRILSQVLCVLKAEYLARSGWRVWDMATSGTGLPSNSGRCVLDTQEGFQCQYSSQTTALYCGHMQELTVQCQRVCQGFQESLSGTIHVSFWQSDVVTSHICCDLSWSTFAQLSSAQLYWARAKVALKTFFFYKKKSISKPCRKL